MRVVFHGIICLSVKTANIRPSPLVAGIRGCQMQNIAVNEQSISYKRVKSVIYVHGLVLLTKYEGCVLISSEYATTCLPSNT